MKPGTRARLFLCPVFGPGLPRGSWRETEDHNYRDLSRTIISIDEEPVYLNLSQDQKTDRGASGSTPGFEPGDRGSSPRGPANYPVTH